MIPTNKIVRTFRTGKIIFYTLLTECSPNFLHLPQNGPQSLAVDLINRQIHLSQMQLTEIIVINGGCTRPEDRQTHFLYNPKALYAFRVPVMLVGAWTNQERAFMCLNICARSRTRFSALAGTVVPWRIKRVVLSDNAFEAWPVCISNSLILLSFIDCQHSIKY